MLTEHQQEVFKKALEILSNQDRLLIKGSAGVGKTFLVSELIKELKKFSNPLVYCTAPTHKAVAVLKEKMTIPGVELLTTHSALKLKRVIDFKTGNVSFKPNFTPNNPPLRGVKYLIVDEASMLPLSMVLDIEEHATKNNCKVIFLGDEKQLNPVGEEDSPVFVGKPTIVMKDSWDGVGIVVKENEKTIVIVKEQYPTLELTEIVRQQEGNPIIHLSRNLNLIDKNKPEKTEIGGYLFTEDQNKILETLAAVNGTDELKYLSFTNADVDAVNNAVRRRIYGNPAKIELGESLIFNAPYGDNFYTNQEIVVEKLAIKEKTFKYLVDEFGPPESKFKEVVLKYYSINAVKKYEVDFKEELSWDFEAIESAEEDDTIRVIHEDSEEIFRKVCNEIKNCAKANEISWIEYYNFVEQFADIKYNHAITVHKSQGSTFKQVIVNIPNININRNKKERDRLLYTAVTRASNLLILYK